MDIKKHVAQIFEEEFGHGPSHIARAPGRVNLLGEHVDYNDGFVLPAAIDRATYVAFAPLDSHHSTIYAFDFRQKAIFSVKTLRAKTQLDGTPLPDWAKYPVGVVWSLSEAGLAIRNFQAVFASDVPRGAGLSSSASVELAFATSIQAFCGWHIAPIEMAQLCQRAENKYVGVNCGIMDQFASACGEKDRVLLLDCRSLKYQSLPLPEEVLIVIADTTVRHTLTSSAYNERRAACEESVRILRGAMPGINALRDVSISDFNRLAAELPPEVEKRARHVVEEIDRTNRAVDLMKAGDIKGFGRLMNDCHKSLRDLYDVSCPELDVMARIAQSLEGCFGARLTGAGFGGCTVNLVAREKVDEFARALASGYYLETGLQPEIYVCRASAGAGII